MSYRTNPDRILDNIDRARNRAAEAAGLYVERQAVGRELDTEMPDVDATTTAVSYTHLTLPTILLV